MKMLSLPIILVCSFGVSGPIGCAQENSNPSQSLRQDKAWSCVSALQKSELLFYEAREDSAIDHDAQTIDWRLVKGTRVIARGRANQVRNNERNEYGVQLDLSDVKIRAVIEVELQLIGKATKTSKKIYLFPGTPFEDQQAFLTQAKIHLFDPVGDTQAVFESAKIPFHSIPRLESFDSLRDTLIVIGEGLNLGQHPGLIDSLSDATKQNNKVILLAPSKGSIALELTDQNRLVLEDETVIKRIDRRFDIESWAGDSPISVRWEISQSKNELSLRESDSLAAWPWIELQNRVDANSNLEEIVTESTFIFCGLGIVSRWNDGPVAQHLLWELIRQNSNRAMADRANKPTLAQERTGETNDQ